MVIRQSRRLTLLKSADDVVDAVGGTVAAARLADRPVQSISNSRAAGRLPSATFLKFGEALAERGYAAPSMLWGIEPGTIRKTT